MTRPVPRLAQSALAAAVLLQACASERYSMTPQPVAADVNAGTAMAQLAAGPPVRTVEQVMPVDASSRIAQLPSDRRAGENAAPEDELTRADASLEGDRSLYRDVATAWQAIRARGQQPTPELIAQAVGPENLTTFLSTFRNARQIFRPDIDAWPIVPAGDPRPGSADGKRP